MTLQELISKGEELEKLAKSGYDGVGKFIETNKELEEWAARSVMHVEDHCASQFLIDKVRENGRDLTRNSFEKHQAILGILKSLQS